MKQILRSELRMSQLCRSLGFVSLMTGLLCACHSHDKMPVSDIEVLRAQGQTEARLGERGRIQVEPSTVAARPMGMIADLKGVQVGGQDWQNPSQIVQISGNFDQRAGEIFAGTLNPITIGFKFSLKNLDENPTLDLFFVAKSLKDESAVETRALLGRGTLNIDEQGDYIFTQTLDLNWIRQSIAARQEGKFRVYDFSLQFVIAQASSRTSQLFTVNFSLKDIPPLESSQLAPRSADGNPKPTPPTHSVPAQENPN